MAPLARPAASERKALTAHRHRLRKAAGAAVEALERRQLLSAAQPIDYSVWLHLDPAFRRDLLAEEHAHPAFAMLLEADLRSHGLPALDAAAAALLPASLSGSAVAAASHRFTAMLRQAARQTVRDHKPRMHKTTAHPLLPHLAAADPAIARGHHPATPAHHPAAHHLAAHPHPKPHRPRPGHAHFGFAVSPSGPMVTASSFTYKTLAQNLAFTFSEDVHASLSLSSITIQNTSTGATLTPLSYSWSGLTATFNLTASSGPTSGIPDGYYTATLNGQTIKDANGNALIGTNTFNFAFLNGDVEQDGTANQSDMNVITANYGHSFPVGSAFQYGDVSFDANNAGNVGFDDLLLLDREYNTTLFLVTPNAPTASQITSNSLMLSWQAVGAPSGFKSPVGYNVYRNGTLVANDVVGTSFVDSGLSPSTAYTYTVASVDEAGEHSVPSAPASVTTKAAPAGGSYNPTPPAAPTNVRASSPSDSSIALSWTASTSSNVSGYEIDRWSAGLPMAGNAAEVGYTTGATSFTDTGLDAGQSYDYAVEAYDPTQDRSSPATILATVGPDKTAPDAPSDLQLTTPTSNSVKLTWVQPWDNVGVTSYLIYRNGTQVATSPTTSWTDTSPGVPTSDNYDVIAEDAAGKMSAASNSVSPNVPAHANTAPNQYIPPDWQTYFYNKLTAGLRQQMELLPGAALTPPPAALWLDASDTTFAGAPVYYNGLRLIFHDLNGNGQLDPGESAWIDSSGLGTYVAGESVIAGPTPAVGTPGGAYTGDFIDTDWNGTSDHDANSTYSMYIPGKDVLVPNPSLIQGQSGLYYYEDIGGVGHWQANDPVWLDTNGNHTYQTGDQVIYPANATVPVGTWGKTNGISYADFSDSNLRGNGNGNTRRVVWADSTTFRQDFAAFYPAMDQLIPYFGNPSGTYPGDTWTKQTLLQQITPGASDWMLVPNETDSGTGHRFYYEEGEPTVTSPVFPQQFQQLHDALAQLTVYPYRFNQWLFDSTTSNTFIGVATNVINACDSFFGASNSANPDIAIKTDLKSGDADPGSVYKYALIADLRSAVDGLAADVYVRGGGQNGWTIDSYGSPPTFGNDPIVRGQWLTGGNGTWSAVGVPISSSYLTEISNFLNGITTNGLWISKGGTLTYATTNTATDPITGQPTQSVVLQGK